LTKFFPYCILSLGYVKLEKGITLKLAPIKTEKNRKISDPRLIQELPLGKDPIKSSKIINGKIPLFRLSIRLAPSIVSSISLKVHFVALWCLLGSQRETLFPKGRVFPLYSELQGAIGDFIYYSVLKKFKGKPISSIKDGTKGLSDFVFSCLCLDILRCSIPSPKRKEVPNYVPKHFYKIVNCLMKGDE
jgi:hypothetical protein